MKKILLAIVTVIFLMALSSWADDATPRVRLDTSMGEIVLELDSKKAPKTVENFLAYVDSGFYDRTIFHRVIKGFMIQGGGFDIDMNKKTTRDPITNEADNGLSNKKGTVAMARTNLPHSATSQFFINTANNVSLNHRNTTTRGYGYCVFGKVVKGMDVVKKIENADTIERMGRGDVPIEPILIEKAILEE